MSAIAYQIADLVFTLAKVGLERDAVVGKVRTMEEAGASPDEITDALKKLAAETEAEATAKAAPKPNPA